MDKFNEQMHHNIGIGGIKCYCCDKIARKGHDHKSPELHRSARARMNVDARKKIEEGIEDWDDSQAVPEYWDTELEDWVSFETLTTLKWKKIGTRRLSLSELEKRLDDSLNNETKETLTEWLKEQRKNEN